MEKVYSHIAVASTFSPTFSSVLSEAWRISSRFPSKFSLIHAADADQEKEARFRLALRAIGAPEDLNIFWSPSPSALDGVTKAIQINGVDLLIAGSLERPSEHRHFLGAVARGLMMSLPCDLLLLPRSLEDAPDYRHVVVAVDPSMNCERWIEIAAEMIKLIRSEQVTLVAVNSPFINRLSMGADDIRKVIDTLQTQLEERYGLPVEGRIIQSNTGFTLCDFVASLDRALLLVEIDSTKEKVQLPRYMDWLFQVIPCNTWIIKPE